MQSRNRVAFVAGVIVIVLGASSTARGQTDPANQTDRTEMFRELSDAVPTRFFDAPSSVIDGNKLIIGLNTGRDSRTWKDKDFRASTAAYSSRIAIDTISFRVVAPEGFYISSITYTQTGTGWMLRTGSALGGTNWVVGEFAEDLGTFATNPNLSGTMYLTGLNRSEVRVSITSSLFAFATPALGSASVAITGAEVYVELTQSETAGSGTPVSTESVTADGGTPVSP